MEHLISDNDHLVSSGLNGAAASQMREYQISECVLQAMVPEEHSVVPRNLHRSVHHQACDLLEVSTEGLEWRKTYLLPIGSLCGLISWLLKAAKNSSTGEAS